MTASITIRSDGFAAQGPLGRGARMAGRSHVPSIAPLRNRACVPSHEPYPARARRQRRRGPAAAAAGRGLAAAITETTSLKELHIRVPATAASSPNVPMP
jgi:hypothetical protein